MTTAFVLSGAGNFGSLQVGALQALTDRGILPDLLVGTSAGAMNAAYLAVDGSSQGMRRLADLWRSAARDSLSRGHGLMLVWRLLTRRDGLLPNDPLRRLIERMLPPGVSRFGDLHLPTFAVAARLDTGEMRCFGDDPADRILDGLMASTAIPGFFPPWVCDGVPYIDGGVSAFLPIRPALDRGATQVYALNVNGANVRDRVTRGPLAVAGRSVDLLLQQQAEREVEACRSRPGVVVHEIVLSTERDIAFWDFAHSDEMIVVGYRLAAEYLDRSGR